MMKIIIGFDISKAKVNYCLTAEGKVLGEGEIVNNKKELKEGMKLMLSLIDSYVEKQEFDIRCVMEYTGIYNNLLLEELMSRKLQTSVVHAGKIKGSSGIERLKTDKVDARKIAEYGFRFSDKLTIWKPISSNLQKIKVISKQRSSLVKMKKQITQGKKDFKKFLGSDYSTVCEQVDKGLAALLEEGIDKLEKEMLRIIEKDSELNENYKIVKTVPGIGPVIGSAMLVATENFTKFDNAKQFACYCGVVPFEQSSGVFKGKAKVSKMANKSMKTLMHMGATSVSKSKGAFGKWYRKKVGEGKNPMSVLNGLRNKMIITAFACVKNKRFYCQEYVYEYEVARCG